MRSKIYALIKLFLWRHRYFNRKNFGFDQQEKAKARNWLPFHISYWFL